MIEQITAFYDQFVILLESWGYWGMFFGSALAASIVPFPSEVLFVFCVTMLNPFWCVLVASIGNTLGGVTLYWMGMLGKLEWFDKYTRIDSRRIRGIRYWIRHKGAPIALLAFLPAIGQCIVIALGLLRCDFPKVTLFMFIGKCIRYVVVAMLVLSVI